MVTNKKNTFARKNIMYLFVIIKITSIFAPAIER